MAHGGAGLALFFLRSRPVRAAGVLAAVAGLVVMSLVTAVQFLQIPGAVLAASQVGRAEYALPVVAEIPLGVSGADLNKVLVDNVKDAGGADVRTGYVIDGVQPDGQASPLRLEEQNWTADPFPGRFKTLAGRMPVRPGEVAVSRTVASEAPLGSEVSFFKGRLQRKVVGVVQDESIRNARMGLMMPGTWDQLAQGATGADGRFGVAAAPTLYWSGLAPEIALPRVASVVNASNYVGGTKISADDLVPLLRVRIALEEDRSPGLTELSLAVLVAPLVAGIFGGWFASRFVGRIRRTLLTIGIFRTRLNTVVAILGSSLLGSVVGSLLGLGATVAARPILDRLARSALGHSHSAPNTIINIMLAGLGGSLVALLATRTFRSKMSQSQAAAGDSQQTWRRFLPHPSRLVPVVMLLLFVAGIIAIRQPNVNMTIAGTVSFGLIVVCLAPYLLRWISSRSSESPPVQLALRRQQSEAKPAGRAAIALGSLLLMSLTFATLYTSSYTTINSESASQVPPGQLWLEPSLDEPQAAKLRSEVEDYLDLSDPVRFAMSTGSVTLGDGATLVIKDRADLEQLLGRPLTSKEHALFSDGGTLRTKEPNLAKVTFESEKDSFELAAMTLGDVDPSLQLVDGFITTATTRNHQLSQVRTTWAYTNLTSEQLSRVPQAIDAIGFNAEWLEAYQPPDERREPAELTVIAIGVAVIGGLIAAYFAAAMTRTLRPVLSSLRAMGMPNTWLIRTLVTQISILLTIALAVAIIGAIASTAISIALGGWDFDLYIPWRIIMITLVGTCALTLLATAISSRRLTATERFESQ